MTAIGDHSKHSLTGRLDRRPLVNAGDAMTARHIRFADASIWKRFADAAELFQWRSVIDGKATLWVSLRKAIVCDASRLAPRFHGATSTSAEDVRVATIAISPR
jgi:hypothetical protein